MTAREMRLVVTAFTELGEPGGTGSGTAQG